MYVSDNRSAKSRISRLDEVRGMFSIFTYAPDQWVLGHEG